MPRMNGTGPSGQGPQTGRSMGRCADGQRMFWCGQKLMSKKSYRLNLAPEEQLKILNEEEEALNLELEILKKEKRALEDQK